jgi:Lon protease-like protein
MMQSVQMALFPLPVFLLPGGVTRLRIFEQKYLRMVKEAGDERHFALSLYKSATEFQTAPWASWVEIIDFGSAKDDILTIDVRSKGLLDVTEVWMESDGLRQARFDVRPHWLCSELVPRYQHISDELLRIFKQNPELAALYPEPQFEDAAWVAGRFLEILPFSPEHKEGFCEPETLPQALKFLDTILTGQED